MYIYLIFECIKLFIFKINNKYAGTTPNKKHKNANKFTCNIPLI